MKLYFGNDQQSRVEKGAGPALENREVTGGCICEQKPLRGRSSSNLGSVEGSPSEAIPHPAPNLRKNYQQLTISGAHRTESVPRSQEGWVDLNTQGAEVQSSEGLH